MTRQLERRGRAKREIARALDPPHVFEREVAVDGDADRAPDDAGLLVQIVEMRLGQASGRGQARVVAARRRNGLTVRLAQDRDEILRQAVDGKFRGRHKRSALLPRRSRPRGLSLRRGLRRGRGRGGRDRGGRVQILAKLGHLLLHDRRCEIRIAGETVLMLEVPISGPRLLTALAVNLALIIAELGEAALGTHDGLNLLFREPDRLRCCANRVRDRSQVYLGLSPRRQSPRARRRTTGRARQIRPLQPRA